jgi:hypothetical protein
VILLNLLPGMAAMLFFGAGLGDRGARDWQAIYALPPLLAFLPWMSLSILASLSPLMVPVAGNPALATWISRVAPWYHLPPWWSAVIIPLAAGLVSERLASRGTLVRRLWGNPRVATHVKIGAHFVPTVLPPPHFIGGEEVRPDSAARSETGVGSPQDVLIGVGRLDPTRLAPSPSPAPPLPFREPGAAIHSGGKSVRQAEAAGSGPVVLASTPIARDDSPHLVASSGQDFPLPPGSEWRWRPLSPLAASVLRWLTRHTDNPVALYSARRALPGTLNSDQIALALLALGLVMLVAYTLPQALYALIIPGPVALFIFPDFDSIRLQSSRDPFTLGMVLIIALLVGITLLSPWSVTRTVANGFRMERERSTLGFLLMTPLSSRGVAIGHCIGALLPAIALWIGGALTALVPATLLARMHGLFPAFWGWGYGFFLSLMYLAMCTVVGMWIGVTEIKARDMTIGVYLLPMSFCVVAAGCSYYAYRYWQWSYFRYNALFVSICLGLVAWLWQNAMKELHRMRRGDVPFEGRTVNN